MPPLAGGIVTDSWYVPARSTMVAPLPALAIAAETVRNGPVRVPLAASSPFGATKIAFVGTGYCA